MSWTRTHIVRKPRVRIRILWMVETSPNGAFYASDWTYGAAEFWAGMRRADGDYVGRILLLTTRPD